jgi:hypothetical protein
VHQDTYYDLPKFKDKGVSYQKSTMYEEDFVGEIAIQKMIHDNTIGYEPTGFCPRISYYGIIKEPKKYLRLIATDDKDTTYSLLYLQDVFRDYPCQLGYMVMDEIPCEYKTLLECSKELSKDELVQVALYSIAYLLLIYRETGYIHVDAHSENLFCKGHGHLTGTNFVQVIDFGNVTLKPQPSPLVTEYTINELFEMICLFASEDFKRNDRVQSQGVLQLIFPRMREVKKPSERGLSYNPTFDNKWFGLNTPEDHPPLRQLKAIMDTYIASKQVVARPRTPPFGVEEDDELRRRADKTSKNISELRLEIQRAKDMKQQGRKKEEEAAKAQRRTEDEQARFTAQAEQSRLREQAEQAAAQEAKHAMYVKETEQQLVKSAYNKRLKMFTLTAVGIMTLAYLLGKTRKKRRKKHTRKKHTLS